MSKRSRGGGVFGLVGNLVDEAKRFGDERAPFPIERNIRRAAGSLVNDEPVAATWESSARGVGRAVLDDGVEEAEAQEQGEVEDLLAQVKALTAVVERLEASRGD
ncbi:MAG TPA: hypothetical protein VL595_37290 [Pseudonocardia sp.]|jgi:hypothetical protein|nr:hypothetical protein [Pseudonocardia sp.]